MPLYRFPFTRTSQISLRLICNCSINQTAQIYTINKWRSSDSFTVDLDSPRTFNPYIQVGGLVTPATMAVLKPQEELPPLPEILSESIRLQVFTHRSYFARPTSLFEDEPDDPAPDNEKLEHLGDVVLGLITTLVLGESYATLRVGPATKIRALVVGNATIADIAVRYRLPAKLRLHPAQAITLRASVNVQADVFESYVGGLYLDQGFEVVRDWLRKLLKPYILEAYRVVKAQYALIPSAYSRVSVPTQSSAAGYLSLFNQHTQQQRKYIEWVFTNEVGENTKITPIWFAKAFINGQCLGSGRGNTKKAAKNEAAKEGLINLGISLTDIEDSF